MEASTAEIRDAIGQLRAMQSLLHRRELELVAEYDRREAWREDGAASMSAWLSYFLNTSHGSAADDVRIAGALDDLPAIADAYANGEISRDQLRTLTRFATPDTLRSLAVEAQKLSAAQVYRMAARHRPVLVEQEQDAHRIRGLKLRSDDTRHVMHVSGRLPLASGAIVLRTLERIVEQSPGTLDENTTYEQRIADALVELSSTRLAEDSDADRATVAVHVAASVLAGSDGVAELEDGDAIAAETARRLLCDSRWYVVVDGPDGRPIGVGRTTRQVPAWLLRELKRRDLGCVFPGCGRRRWIAAHHVVPWSQGGPTDFDNLALLCGTHHRLVHEGGWTIARDDEGGLLFIGPDSRARRVGSPRLHDYLRRRLMGEDAAPDPPLRDTG